MALNSQGQPTKTKPPSNPGTFVGEVKKRQYKDSRDRRTRDVQYYRWDGRAWNITSGEEKTQAYSDYLEQDRQQSQKRYDARVAAAVSTPDNWVKKVLPSLPAPSTSLSTDGVLRYPQESLGGGNITSESDYVLFEFYKYAPPFRKQRTDANYTERKPVSTPRSRQQNRRSSGVAGNKRKNLLATAGAYFDYNQTQDYESAGEKYQPIIMYMPEDISTGFKANWGGKAISTFGTGLLKSVGADGLDKLDNLAKTTSDGIEAFLPIAGATAIRKVVQKITADTLSNDDIFGGISGAILNPNTELLFSGHDMRNFQLNFKLVPRNENEAITINSIIKTFKKCTLPSRDPGKVFSAESQGINSSFIGVPNVIRVSFMQGPGVHPVLPVYKMCAITSVDANYTPDGAYATYDKGQPVAISLSINFQETKLVFEEELENDSIR